jgi:hypothetical protein
MSELKYNNIEKLAHRLYLKNYLLSRATYYLEKAIFKNTIQSSRIDQAVFVTGLARAGTTVIFNALFQTQQFASLKYSNMPFLLMPNIWGKMHKRKTTPLEERKHGDGILVNNESPEAFDEYFWKVFLNDAYISDHYLTRHDISDNILNEYEQYIKLVCHAQHKTRYITKNNNNVLRLQSLSKLNIQKKIFLICRHPAEHAMSLLKEHQLFCTYQIEDSFSLEYFNFLGHHEFGLHHKPFYLCADDISAVSDISKDNPDYWLYCWKSYYKYILDHLTDDISVIIFEDICNDPLHVADFLKSCLGLNICPSIPEREKISSYTFTFNQSLLQECLYFYNKLKELREY